MPEPLVPAYGTATLAELVPSLAAAMEVPGFGENVLGIPASDRYVVMMVDGLGDLLLDEEAERAPYLAGLASAAAEFTCGVPSTTATSLTSLGTGLSPGQHGIAGYSFRHPFSGGLLNALTWEDGLSGLDVQPRLTAFERLAKAGVQVSLVVPARFKGTGLTVAGLRGGRVVGVPDENAVGPRVERAAQSAASGAKALVYFYERSLDHTGHARGWRSPEWRAALERVDALATALRATLPDDVRLVVTGDHGMVDVPAAAQMVVETVPDLMAEVDLLAGEARLRQAYTTRPEKVARRWRGVLGEAAWVRTRAEAIDEGWFGPLGYGLAPRFGDVLAAMSGSRALMTLAQPNELALIGMHGSLTAAELRVPLLIG